MDMIKIFHGSLTIEDKTSTGAGNVHFSSSDTDISLSSSSMISSSSSVSLFSFDGVENCPSLNTVTTTTVTTTDNSQDNLPSSTLPMNSTEDAKPNVFGHSSQDVQPLISEKLSTNKPALSEDDSSANRISISKCNDVLNIDVIFNKASEPNAGSDDGNKNEKLGEGWESMDCSDGETCKSKLSQLDDSVLQMNLKNLAQYERFSEELEKKKTDGGFVICDLDPGDVVRAAETLSPRDPLPEEASSAASRSSTAIDNSENSFSMTETLENYEKGSLNETGERMEAETADRKEGGSRAATDEEAESRPNKKGHRVKFPSDDKLVTGYVYPAVPWKEPGECSTSDLLSSYVDSCSQYDTTPSDVILAQLREITDFGKREELFSLKGVVIDWKVCETLETIFKRVQFHTINMESTGLTEQTAMVMFDLLNYYEPCDRLVLSSNGHMGIRGWQACGSYLRQSQTLKCLEARHSAIPEYAISTFFRGIQLCANLTSVHLQNSVNPGRSLQLLTSGLRGNRSIQDIFLGDNRLNPSDGLQIANLIKDNSSLQLVDLRNNNLQDTGATYIFEALGQSSNCNLSTLIIWNNKLTKGSMSMLSKMLKTTKSLETINLGHNNITDEGVYRLKEGLIKNNTLLRIGLQAIRVTCEGVVALAEFIVEHGRLQKLDLRGNRLKTAGLMALSQSLKVNKSVTCVAMDTEEEGEKASEGDQVETKKQYISDILAYTVRNFDKIQRRPDPPIGSPDESNLTTTDRSDDPKSSQKNLKVDVSVDSSPPSSSEDVKKNFQLRCQLLESPSTFNSDSPLFPSLGKCPSFEKSSSLDLAQDPVASSSSSLAVTVVVSPSLPTAISMSSDATVASDLEPVPKSLVPDTSPSPPSSSAAAAAIAPPAKSSPTAVASLTTSSSSSTKPHVSKRKFTVSKAILPSIFTKSNNVQPSVLYTASTDLGQEGRGVIDGRAGHDAKVRIIGIQSEEKENATPMDASTNDIIAESPANPPP